MLHSRFFVLDIETIPDILSARRLLVDYESSDVEIENKIIQYHLDITGGKNAFLRQPFHQVVCISFLEAEIQYEGEYEFYKIKQLRSGGNLNSSEADLIRGFFDYLSSPIARLITFNGRSFDIPVLKYRAMIHGVQAAWLHRSGDKWNSYNSRYSVNWHCDLVEALSDFGVSARVKMNEVCAALNIPGKLDTEGSMVRDMYYDGKLKEIRDYCELDVLSTYLIYIRYMHHVGILKNYQVHIQDVIDFLNVEQKERGNLKNFLEEMGKLGYDTEASHKRL
ncbi:3'-5' exonuclease [Candidatus Cyrtobacter comes]|uniref:3'-5' exonuclease n=1 Tax=Candidatus Cyrtobacter comes TaxID=675776 RepID=A0ABU5L8Z3_9RICK|nr:3'-5' exonuclease [Candidatus Cyrtobacter comes]MDZ5762355.1 3'-5' exonuclease [Candidatus Cyrtobacter comes]